MNDDDIRGALSAYAATTPDLDPRAGLPERLARRDRTRRAIVAVTACVAAVVAGTGVAALTRDTGGSQLRVAGDEPSATPSTEPETAEPAEPSPTPHDPSPTATVVVEPSASASTSPAPSPTGDDDLYGGPVSGHARGEQGLRVTATLSRDFTPTATTVTLRVEMTDDDGAPRTTSIEWGDGRTEPIAMHAAACPLPATPLPATPPPPHPADITETFGHTWRNPGSYVVRVRVVSAFACRSNPAHEEAVVSLTIDVKPGRILSNGPAEPTAIHATIQAGTGEEHELYDYLAEFSIEDTDGYVRLVTIDWGDGSKLEYVRNADDCDDGDGRHFPTTIFARNRTHRYDPGEYTATLTWESAGCDGADVQRGRAQAKVVVESVD